MATPRRPNTPVGRPRSASYANTNITPQKNGASKQLHRDHIPVHVGSLNIPAALTCAAVVGDTIWIGTKDGSIHIINEQVCMESTMFCSREVGCS